MLGLYKVEVDKFEASLHYKYCTGVSCNQALRAAWTVSPGTFRYSLQSRLWAKLYTSAPNLPQHHLRPHSLSRQPSTAPNSLERHHSTFTDLYLPSCSNLSFLNGSTIHESDSLALCLHQRGYPALVATLHR